MPKFKEFKRKIHAQCENFAPNDTTRLKSKKTQQRQKKTKGENLKTKVQKKQIFKDKIKQKTTKRTSKWRLTILIFTPRSYLW